MLVVFWYREFALIRRTRRDPMPIKRVVIVHGHNAYPMKYWFTDLAEFLRKSGCTEVVIPQMPRPHLPDIRTWKRKLSSIIGNTTDETAVIGHSFGGIAVLRLAEEIAGGRKLGAVIVVSCPIRWVWGHLRARWLYREPDWIRVQESVCKLAIIHSTNDWIAPFNNATYLQDKTSCELLVLHGYGHVCCPILPIEAKNYIICTLGLS